MAILEGQRRNKAGGPLSSPLAQGGPLGRPERRGGGLVLHDRGAPWRANKLYGGFQMGLTRCLVRLSWEPWGSGPVLQVSAGRDQWFEVVGAAVSANGIPAVHLDTLQDVMDQAVVRDIMDA